LLAQSPPRESTIFLNGAARLFAFPILPHLGGLVLRMQEDRPLRPIDACLFHSDSVALRAQDILHLVEQLLGAWFLWHPESISVHFMLT